jgi:NADP-dependent 3-hydroxy acid dehydrogenase YdfG
MKKKPLVVITGASAGIGQTTAIKFSQAGYPLLLLARRIDRLEELKLPDTMYLKVDVTDRNAFKKAVKQAEAKYGPTDCLVNCAGIMLLGEVRNQNPEEWDKMFEVDVKGVLAGMHAVLDEMTERKHGTIINISSIAGRKTFPNHAVYCAAKFAVHAVSENTREEVAKYNVRIITIAPGVVETELLGHTTSKEIKDNYQAWKKQVGQVLAPEDVAKTIIFAYEQPQYVCIREIVLAATGQEP